MRFPIYSLLVPALVFALLSSADAHSTPPNSHIRRSLSNKLQRRQSLTGTLNGLVGDVADGLGLDALDLPLPTPTPPAPAPTSSTEELTDTSSSTSSSTSASTTDSETSTTALSTTETTTSTEAITTTASTTSARPTGILGPVTGIVGSAVDNLTSILAPTSITASASESTSASTSVSDDITSAPTSAPTSEATATTSTTDDGNILTSLTSILLPPSSTASSTSDIVTSLPSSVPTSVPTTSTTSDSGGIISDIISSLTSILDPPSSSASSTISEPPPVTTSDSTSEPVTNPPTSVPTSDASSVPVTSQPVTEPPTSVPTTSVSASDPVTEPPTSISTSITISFPTGSISNPGNSSSSTTEVSITSEPTPSPTISINSDLSFILTESSLIFTSIASSTADATLTDPDQATTTVETEAGPASATSILAAPLPTGIPGRIYPRVQLDTSQDLSEYTMISILFNQELNWPFVVTTQISSSQIFAWLPAIIATALQVPADQVKTWALQVYVPASYRNTQDSVQLGTMWLGYIPSDQVDTLAAQIKAKQSAFYTGVPDNVAKALASHVNSGFSLNAVPDPNLTPKDDGAGSGSASGAAATGGKTRQDAIIGVVSALGAIALLVLAFLVYRSIKRRRELAHRRLSDPPDQFVVGARPEGREFDQDSVGGARRRSFYYAEDSLRGFQGDAQQQQSQPLQGGDEMMYDARSSPQNMMQRRNVMPAAISAPILRESSMNW